MSELIKQQTVYLIRHGKVAGEPALYGQSDVPVEEKAHAAMVEQLRLFIAQQEVMQSSVLRFYSSPLQRCLTTAKACTEEQVNVSAGLSEMDFGCLDGVLFSTLFEEQPEQWQLLERFWRAPAQQQLPQAESLADFNQRVLAAWAELLSHINNHDQDVIVITHGGVIRQILAQVLSLNWQDSALYSQLNIKNASVTKINITSKAADINRVSGAGVEQADSKYLSVEYIGAPISVLAN
ncbi:histidine phosphatase family protein [Algibacillus agarilyticus]|uniref:histidine phosphatase family protein n=1 Tax=Algibacillus agarilyticus TaxID=2234133 RepID=UPI000DD09EE4|nr:histidine phosphatase family protein [Algibacillus agarilyticus]